MSVSTKPDTAQVTISETALVTIEIYNVKK